MQIEFSSRRQTMDLQAKIRTLPDSPGVYLYKDAEGQILYVGKAKGLRARVRSYLLESSQANAKTGSLMREAADVDYIVVANEAEALALENNLIKQHQPRFNILLRDDKTYPYIKLTAERFPRVYVTRRLRKDGGQYFGPYFPANLAHRAVDLIHRNFLVPSCYIDLTRFHPRPCLQYYIKRCLGPCVKGLTSPERYGEAVRDVELFLSGKQSELQRSLRARMEAAAEREEFEQAARLRDLLSTVEQLQSKQRVAAAEGDDTDVFGFHFDAGRLAVNLFHLRGGHILDRREMFWEELPETGEGGFQPGAFFSALLKQIYIDQQYVPQTILVPVEFEDREVLEEVLSVKRKEHEHNQRAAGVEILVAQRGEKRALLDLAGQNAKHSYDQRFRTLKPTAKVIAESLQDALTLPAPPKRIECFDISHIQGSDAVASMVVWEEGRMNKSEYRKFIIKEAPPGDDFAAMREVITRRYKRLTDEKSTFPGLILIDGGLPQLTAATDALNALEITSQPVASIAKREEIIYVRGQEKEPVVLDRHSPVLHLVQQVRDEAHRFAVTFHRKRREIRDRSSELLAVPGIGQAAARRLVEHFGSIRAVKQADAASLAAVLRPRQVEAVLHHFKPDSR